MSSDVSFPRDNERRGGDIAATTCDVCKGTPCQCFIGTTMLDEAALAVETWDEDGNVLDRWVLSVDEEGKLMRGVD